MRPEAEEEPAEQEAKDTKEDTEKDAKKKGSSWKELPLLIVIALGLALVIKTFAVQAFYIPSGSMENTLRIGDRVLVNKIVYHTRDVERGDVIVFRGPPSWQPEAELAEPGNPVSRALHWVGSAFGVAPTEKDFIKRVIGVPGDRVKSDGQGRVTVNGVPLDERSYLFTDPVTREQDAPSMEPFDVTVGPGQLWVMGDHRSNSADSRAHRTGNDAGTISVDDVIGRAFVKVWPFDHAGLLSTPGTFEQPALERSTRPAP